MLRKEDAFRQGHWFSYVFLVDQFDETKQQMSWTVGGFQGGEVCAAENAFVLLFWSLHSLGQNDHFTKTGSGQT